MELETEFNDGTFIATSTAKDRALPVPGVDSKRLPPSTSPEELLSIHRARLVEKANSLGGLVAMQFTSVDDCAQMQDRMHQLRVKHKQAVGLANSEELKKIRGRELLPHEQAIVVELEKLKEAEKTDAAE